MLALDDADLVLDASVGADTYTTPLAQTPSLGLKQCAVRWLPSAVRHQSGGVICLAGSWDEEANELSAWSVLLDGDDGSGDVAMGDEAGAQPSRGANSVVQVGAASHGGDVLALSHNGGSGGGGLCAYTASGAGGVRCYSVGVDDATGDVALQPKWHAAAPAGGLATLGVSYHAEAGAVCAAGEDGLVHILEPESGASAWRAQSNEPAIYDACWWDAHTAVTAGAVLALWDVRARQAAPSLQLAPSPSAQAHVAAQMLSVSAEAQPPYRLVGGASDGAVHLWDVRAAASSFAASGSGGAVAPLRSIAAHTADVWGVQLGGGGGGTHGHLFSCSSDGTLVAWRLSPGKDADAADDLASGRPLVQLSLPINSLDLSAEHGLLASASDAQVLTFLDLRG